LKAAIEKQFIARRDTVTGQRIIVRQLRLWREWHNRQTG
jgi:hypothetical protein